MLFALALYLVIGVGFWIWTARILEGTEVRYDTLEQVCAIVLWPVLLFIYLSTRRKQP